MCQLVHCRSAWMQGKFSSSLPSQSHQFMYLEHKACMVITQPTSTVWDGGDEVLHPLAGAAIEILHALHSKGALWKAHSPGSSIIAYSFSMWLHNLHVCGKAKGQTFAAAFSHNTRNCEVCLWKGRGYNVRCKLQISWDILLGWQWSCGRLWLRT